MRSTFAKPRTVCICRAALIGACATDTRFTRPAKDFVHLGVTTRTQIEARLGRLEGQPTEREKGLFLTGKFPESSEATTLPNGQSVQPITAVEGTAASQRNGYRSILPRSPIRRTT